MSVSNTGHKCISAKIVEGVVIAYKVSVQWKNETRYRWIPATDDREGALEEALRTRAEFERELGKPRTELYIRGAITGDRPFRGVFFDPRENVSGSAVWGAEIVIDGVAKRTSYSIDRYGYEEARQKAIERREAWEQELWI